MSKTTPPIIIGSSFDYQERQSKVCTRLKDLGGICCGSGCSEQNKLTGSTPFRVVDRKRNPRCENSNCILIGNERYAYFKNLREIEKLIM